MTDPSEKEMLDTLEHCRVTMALSEVQAYAGKWTERDERTIDAIRRVIEERREWAEETSDMMNFLGIRFPLRMKILLERMRDFGEKGK